jgi:hypothetical protein
VKILLFTVIGYTVLRFMLLSLCLILIYFIAHQPILKCKYCTSKLSMILFSHATLVARTACFSLTVGSLELICNVSESDEPQNTNSYAARSRKLLLGCKLSSG